MDIRLCVPQVHKSIYNGKSAEGKPLSFYPGLCHTTHSVMQVCDAADSPQPGEINVRVLDLSENVRIPVTVKSTDTTDTLVKKCLEQRPGLRKNLSLVFNGKEVPPCKSLGELGVKSGAEFITFQKCMGG